MYRFHALSSNLLLRLGGLLSDHRRPRAAGSSGGATPRSSTRDSSDPDDSALRKRSVLAYNHGASHREVDEGQYPTNEQVVEALQVKIAKSVEVARRYRRVLWYSLFVTVYLVVLYLQANAYKSADVVSTLQNALMVDGSLSMTFNNEDEVLAYLANKILLPTWKDPVCGDGAQLTWSVPHGSDLLVPHRCPFFAS